MLDEQLQVNRTNWNERTPVHAASESYDVEGFKAGRITLHDVERGEMGDVSGKTLLHLQCHFGLDTMSWARLGAKATGVDFSDAAIDLARSLNTVNWTLMFDLSAPMSMICQMRSMSSSTSCSLRYGVSVLAAGLGQVGVGGESPSQAGRHVLHHRRASAHECI